MEEIDYYDVKPPLTAKDWELLGTYKYEVVNGDVYMNIPDGKWRDHLSTMKSDLTSIGYHIKGGIYIDEDSGELMRIVGGFPEYSIYLFSRR